MDLRCFNFLSMYDIVQVMENAEVHMKRIRNNLPKLGKVGILCITDKQFANIQLFYGEKPKTPNAPYQQLELF